LIEENTYELFDSPKKGGHQIMQKQCIVLHESVSRAEIDYAAYKGIWTFARALKDNSGIVREVVFQELIRPTGLTENFLHYMIEKVKDLPFLIIEGESIETSVRTAYEKFPIHLREDIISMVKSPKDPEEYIKGILYLGLQGKFKESDNETLDIFKQVLQDKNSDIRTDAIIAMSYACWSEFQDLVKPLAEKDPDPKVRQTAARFLQGLELP
jgi:hypothetical protein